MNLQPEETLVQLVRAYEAEHHAIDTTGLTGLDSLKHLLEENQMSASDLARPLGVHSSLGSKILTVIPADLSKH